MSDINYESVKAGLTDTNPAMEALSGVLRQVSAYAAGQVGSWLLMAGVDPSTMPAEYFLQAMLVEAEKVFQDVKDQDNWNRVYTSYKEVNEILTANPDLRQVREDALRKAAADARAEVEAEHYAEFHLDQDTEDPTAVVESFLRDLFGDDE